MAFLYQPCYIYIYIYIYTYIIYIYTIWQDVSVVVCRSMQLSVNQEKSYWLDDWLIDWLTDWLIDWLTD